MTLQYSEISVPTLNTLPFGSKMSAVTGTSEAEWRKVRFYFNPFVKLNKQAFWLINMRFEKSKRESTQIKELTVA